jgi:hypothetical protein
MALAAIGHRRQQFFFETLAKADGRSSDPALSGRSRQSGKLLSIGDPNIGEAVGEKQHPADVGADSLEHLYPFQPAPGKVGLPAGMNAADGGR